MLKLVACAAAAVLATGACKKKEPAAGKPPGDATATVDAAAPDVETPPPSEDSLRAGKRTGLGGPDEQPEVATEDLARALLAGTTPWSRVVSPTAGVVELRVDAPSDATPTGSFMGRRCGAEVDAALGRLGTAAIDSLEKRADLGYELACDNSSLAGAAAVKSAICSIDSPAEYSLGYDLVFVPDPTLGLRLVGFTIVDGGAEADREMDAFELELAKSGKLCP